VHTLDVGGSLKITHRKGRGDLWDKMYILVEGTGGGEGEIQWGRGFNPSKLDIECVLLIPAGAWK
jgi:hypothetical protein